MKTPPVTGGSRGLGRALAEAALEGGHRAVATARDVPRQPHLVRPALADATVATLTGGRA